MEKYMELTKEELIMIILKQNEIFAELMAKIAELEARLNQNSSNSSKPPSSDGLTKPTVKSLREKTGKKPGGQKGHKGHGLKIEREPDEVIIVQPVECHECGGNLFGAPMFHADTKYVYDVRIDIELIKYDILEAICPDCGATVVATPPAECKGTLNYGNMLRALCVVLTYYANVGIDKVHKILHDLLGVPISGGTIRNIMSQFSANTDCIIAKIKENLLKSPTVNSDETGARVDGRTQWFHVVSNSKCTLLSVHPKRGKEGSAASGVIPEYTGTLLHDFWKPYFGFDKCKHALCCAHLLRELNALIERGQVWAVSMKSLLLEMKAVVEQCKDNDKAALSKYYREKFKTRYDDILLQGKSEITPSNNRSKSKAENLLIRFDEYRVQIIRFTEDFDVPFDNNQAERDIRHIKVKQKVSGCFRTQYGAEEFAKASSVIGTAIKSGLSVVNTVCNLFVDNDPQIIPATE